MKRTVKGILAVVAALAVLAAAAMAVLSLGFGIDIFDRGGWHETRDGGVQFRLYDGTPVSGWHTVEGRARYFDPENNCTLVTGWLTEGSRRYWLAEDGTVTVGWAAVDGQERYFAPSGALASGWLTLPEGTYFLDEQGVAHIGWLDGKDGRRYFGEDGVMVTGRLELDGAVYHLKDDGVMHTGWLEGRQYFREDGTMVVGWLESEGQVRHFDEDGFMVTGWADIDADRYWFDGDGIMHTGWLELDGARYFFGETGAMVTGWQDVDGRRYFGEDGAMVTGWLELEGKTYWLKPDGVMHTGWLESPGGLRWFREDGVMALGRVVIDKAVHFFDSRGYDVLLVNPWNYVPKGYTVKLVWVDGYRIAAECADALKAMMADCRAAGIHCGMSSGYRTHEYQTSLWTEQVERYVEKGYDRQYAEDLTSKSIAIPGTSEHQLGLAVDLTRDGPTYDWLAANSWKYGFVVRYLYGETDWTGIYYEPWHYRYVGKELAKELYDLGICLEEYMYLLTEQAGYDTWKR